MQCSSLQQLTFWNQWVSKMETPQRCIKSSATHDHRVDAYNLLWLPSFFFSSSSLIPGPNYGFQELLIIASMLQVALRFFFPPQKGERRILKSERRRKGKMNLKMSSQIGVTNKWSELIWMERGMKSDQTQNCIEGTFVSLGCQIC